jgi:hypothetical protein
MPHPRHRTMLTGLSLAACAAVGTAMLSAPAVPAASAAAGTRAPTPFSAHTIAVRQFPLLKVANKILQLTGQGATPGYSGYGDVTISIPRQLVTLYWHGTLPPALRLRLAQLRSTARIQVKAAPYSWQQLETQASQIAGHETALRADGYTIATVGPDSSASDVHVGVDYARSSALTTMRASTRDASTAAAEAASAQAAIRRLVPGPAPVTITDTPLHHPADRNSDTSPWWGGSRIVRDGNATCSTGFAVVSGSTHYLLTAGHCGGINTSWQTGDKYGSGSVVGTETARDPCCDTAIIKVGANEGYIYDRGWNSNAGEIVEPDPWSAVAGTSVCTEGATSGVRCNITVTATGQKINYGTFTAENESEGTEESYGQQAVADGDSGGPVIINSSSVGTVYATGTITAGDDPVDCSNNDPGINPDCFGNVDFEEIVPILNRWTVNLVSG